MALVIGHAHEHAQRQGSERWLAVHLGGDGASSPSYSQLLLGSLLLASK